MFYSEQEIVEDKDKTSENEGKDSQEHKTPEQRSASRDQAQKDGRTQESKVATPVVDNIDKPAEKSAEEPADKAGPRRQKTLGTKQFAPRFGRRDSPNANQRNARLRRGPTTD